VGLIGTEYTMDDTFYQDKLKAHGIEVCLPASHSKEFGFALHLLG